jgi:CDGSH-type Zn-finger protein
MSDMKPTVAGRKPMMVEVEEGKSYWWCACGQSTTQPFCDGKHKGSGFSPIEYKAAASEEVWFCTCKQTSTAPLCDGAHKRM